MRTPLTRNLQSGFGFSLLFLIAISLASYISIQDQAESARLVDHSKLVVRKLENALSIMKDAETGQRGYLYTNDDEFLEPYTGSYQKAVNTINEFKKLTVDNPQQQQNAAQIDAVILKRLDILQKLIDKHKSGQKVTTSDLLTGKSAMDALRSAIGKAESDEDLLLNARREQLEHFTSLTPVFLILATLAAIAISIVAYFRVINGIAERARLYAMLEIKEQETAAANEELAAVNEELASANEELNALNDDLAAVNEELNASNEDIAAVNEELNASNEDLAAVNEELAAANEEVNASNEDLAAANEELNVANEQLLEARDSLKTLNDELEDRVESRTRELTESESRFKVMMATMPQIAWTSTPTGEITFFNKQWYDYTGLNKEQSLGWGWASVIHPDDLEYGAGKYKSILESGSEGEFEARKKRADGEYRWHLMRIQPVTDDDNKVQLWVGTATDIHDLKNLQQQKDDFISIASHELKTPVTSLKVSLQLLERNKDNPSAAIMPKLISQANKSLERVNILIEDLLNVSKLNQGQLHLNKTKFIISQVINDCCQHIRMEGAYSIVTGGDLKLEAFADAERIEQVVVNFVNNAMKYAPESRVIEINISKENNMARVSVTDKGPGIPADKVPHLFDRYYRVDSQGIQFSGLGLGLYISSEIIKRHDGQIGVDTEVGKGSTFWFTIPLRDTVSLN